MLPNIIDQVRTEILRESQIKSTSSKVLETEVSKEEIKMEQRQEKAVHNSIICDGCGKDPVVGARFKCAVCHDFDLCEDCEANTIHDHPFLKIRHPGQNPMKIICVVDDQNEGINFNGQDIPIPGLQQGINLAQQFFQNMSAGGNGGCQKRKRGPCFDKEQKDQAKEFFKNMMGGFKKPETKEEVKTEKKTEEVKVPETKVEEPKKEEKVELSQPTIVEEKKEKKEKKESIKANNEDHHIEVANYLADILDADFQRCFKFSKKNPTYTKEDLLELYFAQPRLL